MSSTNDTFSSKKTTPFGRRGVQREVTFDSRTTTPFKRGGAPRETTFDVDTSEFDVVSSESRTEPLGAIRWLLVFVCLGAFVGSVIWAAGMGF